MVEEISTGEQMEIAAYSEVVLPWRHAAEAGALEAALDAGRQNQKERLEKVSEMLVRIDLEAEDAEKLLSEEDRQLRSLKLGTQVTIEGPWQQGVD